MPIPAFSDIGKSAKELQSGGKASGAFVLELPKLTVISTVSSGVTFTATAVQKGDKVDASLKAAYSTKKYSLDATVSDPSKVSVNGSLSGVAPGVKLTLAGVVPEVSSGKLGVEYANPYVNLKSTLSLKSTPVIDAAVATGYQNIVLGGEAAYDTAKALLTKYNVALGYHAPDFQVAAALNDKLSTLKLSYAHNITSTATVGAEMSRKLATGSDTSFALAYAKKLTSGCLTKAKIDNMGTLSLLYETKLVTGEKIAGCMQLNATDFSKPPKYGFALDLTA